MTAIASPAADRWLGQWVRVAALPLLLLLLALAVSRSPLDVAVQHWFYDPSRGWLVDASSPLPRRLFYDGPKLALAVAGALGVVTLLLGCWMPRPRTVRRELLLVLLSLALVPAVASNLKRVTDVDCPSQTSEFGGRYLHVPPFAHHPEAERPSGRCFPAGHASGGFALLALGRLSGRRRWRIAGFLAGLLAGSVMGLYQMAKGAHFLSHGLTTLALAWLMTATLAAVLGLPREPGPPA